MNIKQVIFINISFFISLTVLAADRPTQPVRTEVYRLERLDSVLLIDLAVDLTGVHLAPDCTVYLFPLLASENTGDSLSLPPIVLNGPQSDLMYRRRRALGTTSGLEKITPYTVLREGDHALPRIHYRTEVPYAAWMDDVKVWMRDTNCNCDARLVPFAMHTEHIPPLVVERVDTIVIHDTIRLASVASGQSTVASDIPLRKKVTRIQAGYEADIYFPTNEMRILPDHELNRASWMHFVNQVDSIEQDNRNSISGVTVTGYSSPEGYTSNNERLAEKRAKALQAFLENKYGERMEVAVEWVGEDWKQFEKDIEVSDLPERNEILSILRTVSDSNQRKSRLKALNKGKTFEILLREYFPKLRRVSCRIRYVK